MTFAATARLLSGEKASAELLSFDRAASARRFDGDGHLHVVDCAISKATVNPYFGREIPGYQELGLDANKTYMMLRHPDELRAAVPTFDGKPLLLHHKPVHANDHAYDLTIGAISDIRFEHPYLKASLHVWPGKAIDAIQSERQKELSSAYSYVADMTPGNYDGRTYDGVMRSLHGNHVAIVDRGRAGSDVYVADAQPKLNLEAFTMPHALSRKAALLQGALMVTLGPRMAQDQKLDLAPILRDVTAENFDAKKSDIIAGITTACDGKLATGADISDIKTVLDSLSPVLPVTQDEDDDDEDDPKKETPEEKRKRLAALAAAGGASDMITKDQLDAALKEVAAGATQKAVAIARQINEAQSFVRPWVGDMALTFDSAEGVYKGALDALGVKVDKDVPEQAYRYILEAQPKAADRNRTAPKPAPTMDAASSNSFHERFPGTDKIRVAV